MAYILTAIAAEIEDSDADEENVSIVVKMMLKKRKPRISMKNYIENVALKYSSTGKFYVIGAINNKV